MPNEVNEAIEFARTTAAQPMIRTCRKLTVGHSLTPDDVDDLRESADWMEGASIIIAQTSDAGGYRNGYMGVLAGLEDFVKQLSDRDRSRLVAALHRVM